MIDLENEARSERGKHKEEGKKRREKTEILGDCECKKEGEKESEERGRKSEGDEGACSKGMKKEDQKGKIDFDRSTMLYISE